MRFLLLLLFMLPARAETLMTCKTGCEKRNPAVVREFRRVNPPPGPHSVADHVCPLACGGRDAVTNLQWQSVNAAAAKDRWERTQRGCRLLCNEVNSDGRWQKVDGKPLTVRP